MEYKDYYSILEVDRKAGPEEIKKAFRKLARKYHPDVNQGDNGATAKFKEINEAYEVLSDPEKRQKYDRLRAQWQHHRHTGGQPGDFNWGRWQSEPTEGYAYRTMSPEEFEELFGAGGGYSDFFENLFGTAGTRYAGQGAGDSQFYSAAHPRGGRDVEHELQVTLDEAFHGTRRILQWDDGRKVEAKVPPGVKTGSRLRLKGQGHPGTGGGEPGNLYLTIEVLPDKRFQCDGDDIKATIPVDLFTLLLGGTVSLAGIDRTVQLDIPSETRNGRIFRLRGLGMPNMKNPNQRGDLYVSVEAVLPEHLTGQEKELVQQWRNLR